MRYPLFDGLAIVLVLAQLISVTPGNDASRFGRDAKTQVF